MVALIIFVCIFVGFATFLTVKISISCIIWASNNPKDKLGIYKRYFPYYITGLNLLCILLLYEFNFRAIACYYFASVYVIALLIWRSELKQSQKASISENYATRLLDKHVEQNHSKSL